LSPSSIHVQIAAGAASGLKVVYIVLSRTSCLVLVRPVFNVLIEFLHIRSGCPIIVSTSIELVIGVDFILWVVVPVEILRCSISETLKDV